MMMATETASEMASAPGRLKSPPERRCLVTRAVRGKEQMVRFVIGPDSVVTPDLQGRLPGRGLWVSAERGVLETAVEKNLFKRAARRAAIVPDGLVARVEAMLAQRCVELLGLARRAGLAVAGFEKVQARLRTGKVALLLAAHDGAADGRARLAALASGLPVADALDAAEIGTAFGRERAVHAALAPGGLTERLQGELHRLSGLRVRAGVDDGIGATKHRRSGRH